MKVCVHVSAQFRCVRRGTESRGLAFKTLASALSWESSRYSRKTARSRSLSKIHSAPRPVHGTAASETARSREKSFTLVHYISLLAATAPRTAGEMQNTQHTYGAVEDAAAAPKKKLGGLGRKVVVAVAAAALSLAGAAALSLASRRRTTTRAAAPPHPIDR